MRAIHAMNGAAWFLNAVVWYGYAHVTGMAVLSLIGVAAATFMWRTESW